MRLLFTALLAVLIAPALWAQTFDRSYSLRFRTNVQGLYPGGLNRWLALAYGGQRPGQTYTDTLGLVVFNDSAEVVFTYLPALPAQERHIFHDAVVLPDGGFVYSLEATFCDISTSKTALGKVDATGALLWQVADSGSTGAYVPHLIETLLDGDLLGACAGHNKVVKLDGTTGQVLWQTAVPTTNWVDFKVFPGSENIVATTTGAVQLWIKSLNPGGPQYTLAHNEPLTFPGRLKPAGNSRWVFFNAGDGLFYDVDSLGQTSPLPYPFFSSVQDYVAYDSGLVVLQRTGKENRLAYYDASGSVVNYSMPDSSQIGSFLAIRDHQVALAGFDLYGPQLLNALPELPATRSARHLWVRTMNLVDPDTAVLSDVALAGIEQLSPVLITPIQVAGSTYYALAGGNYRLQIVNQGNETVTALSLNFSAPRGSSNFCGSVQGWRQDVTGLNLAPGDSLWLDWGNIAVPREPEVPAALCFSVSAPNRQTDATHADNTRCAGLVTSAVVEPVFVPLIIYPNPATGTVFVDNSVGPDPAAMYSLFDARGRLVRLARLPVDGGIAVDDLENGLYWLCMGGRWGKVVVVH